MGKRILIRQLHFFLIWDPFFFFEGEAFLFLRFFCSVWRIAKLQSNFFGGKWKCLNGFKY
jgi:hypothetical protein